MEHIPTPWKVKSEGHPDIEESVWIDSNTNLKPCIVIGKANAEFIVKAVNSFDDLVTALKRAIKEHGEFDYLKQALEKVERS